MSVASTTLSQTRFELPPIVHNARGEVRKAGFELEYAGLSLEASAVIVRHVFGGRHDAKSPSIQRVTGTRFGTFKLEVDSSQLQHRTYEKLLSGIGVDVSLLGHPDRIEQALAKLFSVAGVPFEIVSPPIPITELAPLDELRRLLQQNDAAGTRALPWYAFGMHINPEIPSEDPGVIRDYIRAFLLLYPTLKKRVNVDLARSILPYINPFPDEYARLILQPDYPAHAGRLIDDYLAFNPTRNRPLDMLPVLAHLDEKRVMSRVEDRHLVKARPAFHYRLPNCLVDEPNWTLAREWNNWVMVERLACDRDALSRQLRNRHDAR